MKIHMCLISYIDSSHGYDFLSFSHELLMRFRNIYIYFYVNKLITMYYVITLDNTLIMLCSICKYISFLYLYLLFSRFPSFVK